MSRVSLDTRPRKRQALIEARLRRGLTADELARQLGISRWSVYKVEAGIRTPPLPLAHRWATALGGTIEELFLTPELDDVSHGASHSVQKAG